MKLNQDVLNKNFSKVVMYCKRIIFSVYDIWRFLDFLLLSVELIWWLICIHLFKPL